MTSNQASDWFWPHALPHWWGLLRPGYKPQGNPEGDGFGGLGVPRLRSGARHGRAAGPPEGGTPNQCACLKAELRTGMDA